MKMQESLPLSILVILMIATSSSVRAAKLKQNEQGVCIAFEGPAVTLPGCDSNCKHSHRNPEAEAVGIFARLGFSPKLCFCLYRCGGHLSSRCRLPSFTLLRKDEDPNVCVDYCRDTYPNALGMSTSFDFGTVCQCDYGC